MFADTELGRCLATCQTYYCIVITVFNVYILMKIKKTSSVMVHTTDGEMRASYAGVRHLIPIWKVFAFSGVPLVDAIIDSKRMTPRCRHLDIPI
jgi:cobalamin biosynthesis Co2+ chelatase CbiK